MTTDFDHIIDRRAATSSLKWHKFGAEVLPLWVADMDFASPEPVVRALRERVEHGVYGYDNAPPQLAEVICERLRRLYAWEVTPEEIVFLSGIVCGFNAASRAFCKPSEGLLVQTPVYPPFLAAPGHHGLKLQTADLAVRREGSTLRYAADFATMAAAATPETRMFLISHPHNPVGLEFRPDALRTMAEFALERGMVICSDEIHCDLLLNEGLKHVPMATLSPEIAARCVTLMAPSKTFNVPGLACGFAIIQNPELRRTYRRAMAGIVPDVNALGFVGALAAYSQESEGWLNDLLAYLRDNRDFLVEFVRRELPEFAITAPETTYLAWMDCRGDDGKAGEGGRQKAEGGRQKAEGVSEAETGKNQTAKLETWQRFGGLSPYEFFLREAKVAFSDGATFGQAGEGFVRINFGCPRPRLEEAMEKVKESIKYEV